MSAEFEFQGILEGKRDIKELFKDTKELNMKNVQEDLHQHFLSGPQFK